MEIFNGEINGVNPAFVKQNESLYNTTESAIQELVDNSIDAESSEINIEVLDNRFVIRDNSSTGKKEPKFFNTTMTIKDD